MNDKPIVSGKYLMYRGKPLVREKNVICYGSMSEKYVLFMAIMSVKSVRGMSIPDKVMIQIMPTDPNDKTPPKSAVKQGFFEAFDLGMVWLDMANKE
jgi:hypothetical protein